MAYPCGQTVGHKCLGAQPDGKGCANYRTARATATDAIARRLYPKIHVVYESLRNPSSHKGQVFSVKRWLLAGGTQKQINEIKAQSGATGKPTLTSAAATAAQPKDFEVKPWTPPTPEQEAAARAKAYSSQPQDGQVPTVESKSRQTVKPDPNVYNGVMKRSGVAPVDCCERCKERAREFKEDGTPIFEHHHMLGRANSDRIETSSRICGICHGAITRGGVNGPRYDQQLIDEIGAYERTKIFIIPTTAEAVPPEEDFWATILD